MTDLRAALQEILYLQMGKGDGVVGDYISDIREIAHAALSGNAGALSDDVLRQTAEQAKAAAAKVTHDARVDPADLQKVYRESGNAGAAEALRPHLIDNDLGEITVTLNDKELRGWSYKGDAERRTKMLAAREYIEGWYDGREAR